jgi:acetylornithine deacetylase/succinyl-diaminopimelate desuccinylase-like protein
VEQVVKENDPRAVVAAFLDQGYTESQMYRKLGIAAYGFNPVLVSTEQNATKHAANERVPAESFRKSLPMLFEVIRRSAAD